MNATKQIKITLAILLALLAAGCTVDAPEHPTELVAPSGEQIFANYVAIGNSLTAGYMDSGLIMNGQATSYPRLIAQQMGLDVSVGDSDFSQPYIDFPGIGTTESSVPGTFVSGVLHFDGTGISVVEETHLNVLQDLMLLRTLPTPYHNLGVPGATVHDVMNAYNARTSTPGDNSYFDFINRVTLLGNLVDVPGDEDPNEQPTMFRSAIAKGPSLLTCWAGNNDVLGGAADGNPVVGENITPPSVFATEYQTLLQSLAGGLFQRTGFPATIVTANIPSITSVPYFMPKAVFETAIGGPWPFGYEDDPNVQMVTFPALVWAANPNHADQELPVPDDLTLTTAEVTAVEEVIDAYNQTIIAVTTAVGASGLAITDMVDAHGLLAGLSQAQRTHFVFLLPQVDYDVPTAAAMTAFSLDGVHPNNHGYGILANAFIDAIANLTGTTIAHVDETALVWDPTYGQSVPQPTAKSMAGRPVIDERAAAGMSAIFR